MLCCAQHRLKDTAKWKIFVWIFLKYLQREEEDRCFSLFLGVSRCNEQTLISLCRCNSNTGILQMEMRSVSGARDPHATHTPRLVFHPPIKQRHTDRKSADARPLSVTAPRLCIAASRPRDNRSEQSGGRSQPGLSGCVWSGFIAQNCDPVKCLLSRLLPFVCINLSQKALTKMPSFPENLRSAQAVNPSSRRASPSQTAADFWGEKKQKPTRWINNIVSILGSARGESFSK